MPQLFDYAGDAMRAQELGVQQGNRDLTRVGNMARYMKGALSTNNPRAIQGAWNAVRPELEKLTGKPMNASWQPEYEAPMEQALARAMGAQAGQPTPGGLTQFNAMTQGLSPDDVLRARRIELGLDPRAVGAAPKTIKMNLPDGRTVDVLQAGSTYYVPTGTAGDYQQIDPTQLAGMTPAQAPTTGFTTSHGEPFDVSQVTDPALRAEIQSNPAKYGMIPDGGSVVLPAQGAPQPALPGLGFSRTPEAEAAAVEAATQGARTAALPGQEAIKTEAEIERARGTGDVKYEQELRAQAPKARSALSTYRASADLMRRDVSDALNSIDWTTVGPGSWLAALPGTPAANLRSLLDSIKGRNITAALQEMRNNSPTGGALGNVSDRENETMASLIASFDQRMSPDQLRRNLNILLQSLSSGEQRLQAAYDDTFAGQAPAPRQKAPAQTGGWSIRRVK